MSERAQIAGYLRQRHAITPDGDGVYADDFTMTTRQDVLGAQQEAARLGFVRADPQDMEYLVVTEYPEEPAPPATAPASLPAPAQTMGEALWLAVRGSVTGLATGQSRR